MATTKLWTVEELEREGPPDGRWELIDGELVEMTPSGGDASYVGGWILTLLSNLVVPRRLGRVYPADAGFVLFPGRKIVRAPDVAFVRAERVPPPEQHAGFLRLVPDLVVEVVSPYDRPGAVAAKAAMWLEAGIRLVWVVNPSTRAVAVHAPARDVRVLDAGDALDGEDVVPGFRVAVADLFP